MKILVTGSVGFIGNTAQERDFGFKPQIGLRESLRKFAVWYKVFYG